MSPDPFSKCLHQKLFFGTEPPIGSAVQFDDGVRLKVVTLGNAYLDVELDLARHVLCGDVSLYVQYICYSMVVGTELGL